MRSRFHWSVLACFLLLPGLPASAEAVEGASAAPRLALAVELAGWASLDTPQAHDDMGLVGYGPGLRLNLGAESPLRLSARATLGFHRSPEPERWVNGWRATLTAGSEADLWVDWLYTYTAVGLSREHLRTSPGEGSGPTPPPVVTDRVALVLEVGLGFSLGAVELRLGYHGFGWQPGVTTALAYRFDL